MSEKTVKDLRLHFNLRPDKELPASRYEDLWRILLSADFRKELGNPDIGHMTTGSGESHIEYRGQGMKVILYEWGHVTLDCTKFSPAKSGQVERIFTATLRAIRRAAQKPVKFKVDAYLHVIIAHPLVKKFLADNIRLSVTRRFKQAFGEYKALKSIVVQFSDTSDIVFFQPNHIDFLYHDAISGKGKVLVSQFVSKSMKYVELMRRAS